jgi:hypothetical protein
MRRWDFPPPSDVDQFVGYPTSFRKSQGIGPASKELEIPQSYLTYLAFRGMAHLGHIGGSPGF